MQAIFSKEHQEPSKEEEDLWERSKRRGKDDEEMPTQMNKDLDKKSMKHQTSYRGGESQPTESDPYVDGDVSDNDLIEKSTDDTWFGIGYVQGRKDQSTAPLA